jgi:hypothetical protein
MKLDVCANREFFMLNKVEVYVVHYRLKSKKCEAADTTAFPGLPMQRLPLSQGDEHELCSLGHLSHLSTLLECLLEVTCHVE